MAHMYEGQPDARLQEDVKPSRFRPRYRQLTEAELKLNDDIKSKAVELEELFNQAPRDRYHSLALTALEQAICWIVKGITQ